MYRYLRLLVRLLALVSLVPAASGNQCLITADVCFVIDISSSIGSSNYNNQVRPFVTQLLSAFNNSIDSGEMRTALVRYARTAQFEYDLSSYNNTADTLAYVQTTTCCSSGTYIGNALTETRNTALSTLRGNRVGVQDVVILFTDGNSVDSVTAPAAALHNDQVLIFAVGVAGYAKSQLSDIASDPDENFLVTAHFSNLSTVVVMKINEMLCASVGISESAPNEKDNTYFYIGIAVIGFAAAVVTTVAAMCCYMNGGCCKRRKNEEDEEDDFDLQRGQKKDRGLPTRVAHA